MQDWLAARAIATPEKIAVVDDSITLRYQHLQDEVTRMCVRMEAAGIQRGDHVGMLMMSSALAVVPFFAALRMGLVFVPLSVRLTVEELDFQLRQSDCKWLLPYGDADLLTALRDKGHTLANLDYPIDKKRLHDYVDADIDLENPALIVHTSGTSGKPKGAVLTAGNLFYSAMSSAYRIGHLLDDKWLCVLPLNHVGGLSIIVRAALYGITVDLRNKFEVEAINHALTHEGITLISLVPTMLYRLLDARTEAWSEKLRLILLGGAAPSAQLVQRCMEEGVPIATTYGLSEASSQVATALPDQVTRKPGTVGKPLLFSQVRVTDEHGSDAPAGEYGEVLVRGLTVMQGYYNNADATAKTLRDGWLHTGDIGYLDEDGDLFLVQRRSDLIVSGGENVYPAEVEDILRQHPAVAEVAVVGIEDAEWGQKVAAAVVLRDGHALTAEELQTFAREHLAGYKIPRLVKFVDALPQTQSGKIQRESVKMLLTN